MSSQIEILKQLKKQGIEFDILYDIHDHNPKDDLDRIIKKWKEKFIGDKTAPHLDEYLWHIFSYEKVHSITRENATKEYLEQYTADTFIFNEQQQYLIRCKGAIPVLEMDGFIDDIYISHHNMKWTYVIPHEVPYIGPFFSIGD